MNEPVTRIVLGGIKLEPWPRYLGKLHRTPPERLEQYLGLSVARITVFKKIALNARFHELYLTQTYQKVTLYHMLRGIIPAGFFGAVCGVPFENLWAQIGSALSARWSALSSPSAYPKFCGIGWGVSPAIQSMSWMMPPPLPTGGDAPKEEVPSPKLPWGICKKMDVE